MNIIGETASGLLELFFPNLCSACHQKNPLQGGYFCLTCKLQLPFTDQFEIEENELEMRIYGRFPFERAAALFRHKKDSKVQDVLQQIKYKNRPQLARVLGELAGRKMKNSTNFEIPDLIIPIPLHYKKQAKRGYNQSTEFGKGVSEVLNIPIYENVLLKEKTTSSQTEKSRLDRLKNVADSFVIKNAKSVATKHVLLLDDVLTTGATTEAAAQNLLEIPGLKISMVLISMAEM